MKNYLISEAIGDIAGSAYSSHEDAPRLDGGRKRAV